MTGAHPEAADSAQRAAVQQRVLGWYAAHGRDLPWRRADATPWGIYVSEIMAQQTPIARIVGPWAAWLDRWPTPTAQAGASPADVIRAWGRLGYPRRAVNLLAASQIMVRDHGGEVPREPDLLLALPGVGDYTAAAVASFAYAVATPVVDTNVRRVLARIAGGQAQAGPGPTRAERELASVWMPADPADGNRWNTAAMELGALVCTARTPDCGRCPVSDWCAWVGAGRPPYEGRPPRGQGYAGTDRQVRGMILERARHTPDGIDPGALGAIAPHARLERCLRALVADGLLIRSEDGYDLPR
ncbi:MAG: A/G-specific adenine glycosylase [Tetrasphaera sp.]